MSIYFDKIGLVMAFLSTSIYRRWFWANYKHQHDQAILRHEWHDVAVRFSGAEIKAGLELWASQRGVDHPPTPSEFYAFIMPQKSNASNQFFNKANEVLKDHVQR